METDDFNKLKNKGNEYYARLACRLYCRTALPSHIMSRNTEPMGSPKHLRQTRLSLAWSH